MIAIIEKIITWLASLITIKDALSKKNNSNYKNVMKILIYYIHIDVRFSINLFDILIIMILIKILI